MGTELYEQNHTSGTVYLQMKRYVGRLAAVRRRRPKRQEEAAKGEEPRCLVRARSNKKKSKISTIIAANDCARFQVALGNILRLQMELKRPAKKKEKGEKKKDGATKPVKKDKPKPKD